MIVSVNKMLSSSRRQRRAVVVAVLMAAFAAAWPPLPGESSESSGRVAERLAGPTRIETAVAVSARAFPDGSDVAYLAAADLSPDAVAAGVLDDGPILLVPSCGVVPDAVLAELDRLRVQRVVALGGPASVAEHILDQAVAGESGSATACAGAIPSMRDGVTVSVEVENGRITVELRNDRSSVVYYGSGFALARRDGGGFEELDPPVGPFTDELGILEPGTRTLVDEFGPTVVRGGESTDLEPGSYRLVKSVWLEDRPESSILVAAEFMYPS